MWLKAITPVKGILVRQHILQLFSETSWWVSLINLDKLPKPSGSDLCNSIQATYEPGTQPPLEIPMKDLALWLGKYVGMSYICTTCLEGYTMCTLTKMAHSDASCLGKHLHEKAKTKDHLSQKNNAAGPVKATWWGVVGVGCIYAPHKVNPKIFQFYSNFLSIFYYTSMHPLLHNFYDFYLIF